MVSRSVEMARSALLSAARGLHHEPAEFLRLPRVGLHLYLGKIALQPQDVLKIGLLHHASVRVEHLYFMEEGLL